MKIAIVIILALAGIILVAAGCLTWGVNNHVIGFPYREMVGLGAVLIVIATAVGFA